MSLNQSGGGQEPADPSPSEPTSPAPVTATPSSPHPQSQGPGRHVSGEHRFPGWKKLWFPASLAILGLALIGAGFALFPSRSQYPPPAYNQITVHSTIPVSFVRYSVIQKSPVIDEVNVTIVDDISGPSPKITGAGYIILRLPTRIHFRTCPRVLCDYDNADQTSVWAQAFRIKIIRIPSVGGFQATGGGSFFVKAHNLGETYNGVDAAAVLPQAQYQGPGSPTLVTSYYIPSAGSYTWNSPTTYANNARVVFGELMTGGQVSADLEVGTNKPSQQQDSDDIFLSGIVLGLAGAALLSAFQEFAHSKESA
jgi:hypothetical protein